MLKRLQQATSQAMELDERVFLMGQLVDYKGGVFGPRPDCRKSLAPREFGIFQLRRVS